MTPLQITLQLNLKNLEYADSDIEVVTNFDMMKWYTHWVLLIAYAFTTDGLHMNFGSDFATGITVSLGNCMHSHFHHFQKCCVQRE